MWRRPAVRQRAPNEDPIAWAHRETIAFAAWKCRVWGAGLCMFWLLAAVCAAGMPLHRYWKWIGIPALLAATVPFAAVLFHGAVLLGEFLDRPPKRRG